MMKTPNMFYTVSYRFGTKPWYVTPDGFGTTDVKNAARYSSFASAVSAAAKKGHTALPDFAIAKITETEVGQKAKLVSKTKIDATKPVVVYNAKLAVYGKVLESKLIDSVQRIEDATIFTDLADALIGVSHAQLAVREQVGRPLDTSRIDSIIHVHQVEVLPASLQYTTEVLS